MRDKPHETKGRYFAIAGFNVRSSFANILSVNGDNGDGKLMRDCDGIDASKFVSEGNDTSDKNDGSQKQTDDDEKLVKRKQRGEFVTASG